MEIIASAPAESSKRRPSLLVDGNFVIYLPALARRTSVNAAIIAQQIYTFQRDPKSGRMIDGELWVWNTHAQWAELLGMTPRGVEGAIRILEGTGVLRSCRANAQAGRDQTKFYRIDPDHPLFDAPTDEEIALLHQRSDGDGTTSRRSSSLSKVNKTSKQATESPTDSPERDDESETPTANSLLEEATQIIKIIDDAREELGLTRTNQDPRACAPTLRQCVKLDSIPADKLVPLAEFMFTDGFNIKNLSFIAQWRKKWANGRAIVTKYEDYLLSLRKPPPPRDSGPRTKSDFDDIDYGESR